MTTDGKDPRSGRLYPDKANQAYCVLERLRVAMEGVRDRYFSMMPDTLLDFGCGSMPYRPVFETRVRSYIGCDLGWNTLADVHVEHIGALPYDEGSIDAVLSTQVLEHVEDPAAYLREALRVLAPRGHLILTTHGAWRYHPDPHDYWRWTSAGLRKEVARAGFEIIHFEGLLGPVAMSLQLLQDNVRGKLPYRLRRYFVRIMQQLVQWSDARASDTEREMDACVYLVVARKSTPEQINV